MHRSSATPQVGIQHSASVVSSSDTAKKLVIDFSCRFSMLVVCN